MRRSPLPSALLLALAACSPAAPPALSSPILPPVDLPVARAPQPDGQPLVVVQDGGAPAAEPPASVMQEALAEWSERTDCQDFDYHPHGGLQSFWCHRPKRLTVESVAALAGVPIFTKGPHHGGELDLRAQNDFGHYDPAFVSWLVEHAAPSPRGSAAQKATQAAYDTHLKPLAEIFWKTYEKSQADSACFAREKAAYASFISRHATPKDYYERWFFFMNPYFCDAKQRPVTFFYDNGFDGHVDGNVTKTVIGFWLRRSLDGTMSKFAEGLKSLLATYQPELIAKPTRYADPAALTAAADAGVKAAASCKDPKSTAKTASVAIAAYGDGHVAASMRPSSAPVPVQHACIESAFAAQRGPTFDGPPLRMSRTVTLK